MIGGLIRSASVLFLLSSCFAFILYPEPREYTLAQLPEKLVGYVYIDEACSGNVSVIYDGKEVLKKSANFDTGALVRYDFLLNFSIPREVGNHTIKIVSECFSQEFVTYSVTDKIPVILSYNTDKLMVDDEFRLDVFGEHVAIHLNNKTFFTSSFNHTFEKPGNYSILVEVWDDFGDYGKRTILVEVSNRYFFNYSIDSVAFPGEKLEVKYSLRDFFRRNLTREVRFCAFGRTYVGNGSITISVPDDTPPGNYTLTFFYRNHMVNVTVFVPRIIKVLDLNLDKSVLNRNEPVRAVVTVVDQTGRKMHLICELVICKENNCTKMLVPANTGVFLNNLYWEPGYYTVSAMCDGSVSAEHLLVPRIQNLSYNYSVTGDVVTITLKNTGNVPSNTILTYCSKGTCEILDISLEKNETEVISLQDPENVSIKYANRTVSLPITGRYLPLFNPWLCYVSLLIIFVGVLVGKLKSRNK